MIYKVYLWIRILPFFTIFKYKFLKKVTCSIATLTHEIVPFILLFEERKNNDEWEIMMRGSVRTVRKNI